MIGDDWYESEERTRVGLRQELRRILRRTRVRPFRVLVVALLVAGAMIYKLRSKPQIYEASVVLAVSEESLSNKKRGSSLPAEQLREYVLSVLLPGKDLLGLIERHNMFPLRKKLGNDYALNELWQMLDVKIWKNSFLEQADEGEENQLNSARIGITVNDTDPDRAFVVARDIGQIIITTGEEQRQKVANEVRAEVDGIRNGLGQRQVEVTKQIAAKMAARERAIDLGKTGIVQAIDLDITELYREQKKVNDQLTTVLTSDDAIADRVTAAGLDMTIAVVEEQRPESAHQRGFVMLLIFAIIGAGSLVAAAFVLGAFDSRVHDVDDVERLGLPVLGHVPSYRGDQVGSLEARGARRSRVPSFLRWRFLR